MNEYYVIEFFDRGPPITMHEIKIVENENRSYKNIFYRVYYIQLPVKWAPNADLRNTENREIV